MNRIIWIVIDSVGVGALPDAKAFGDEGVNTLGHIVKEFNNIKSFYLRGAFHFDSLTFPDKMMMSMVKMIAKARKLDKEGRCMTDMLNKGAKPVDFTKKEYIEPIVNEVRK